MESVHFMYYILDWDARTMESTLFILHAWPIRIVLYSFLYLTFLRRKIFNDIRIIKIAIFIFIRVSFKITYTCGSFSLTTRISFRYSINATRDPFRLSLPQKLHLLPCRFSSPFFLSLPFHSSLFLHSEITFHGVQEISFPGNSNVILFSVSVSVRERQRVLRFGPRNNPLLQ